MIQKKNLILGAAAGYTFAVLEPFLKTLAQTGYSGEVVFFCSNLGAGTIRKLREHGVTLVPFSAQYPYLNRAPALPERWERAPELRNLGTYCLRYLLAYWYLSEHGTRYENVMLTDTRDVIFQKDPFDFAIDDSLCCFMEREGTSIGDSSVNAEWIETGFGKAELERLRHKPIICSGVTIGRSEVVQAYARAFLECIIANHVPADRRGMDQGVHNYLVHEGKLPLVRLYRNSDGPVLTLGLEDIPRLNTQGQVVNSAGTIPNMVHQYDRHWKLAKRFWNGTLLWRARRERLRGRIAAQLSRIPLLRRWLLYVRDIFFRA